MKNRAEDCEDDDPPFHPFLRAAEEVEEGPHPTIDDSVVFVVREVDTPPPTLDGAKEVEQDEGTKCPNLF